MLPFASKKLLAATLVSGVASLAITGTAAAQASQLHYSHFIQAMIEQGESDAQQTPLQWSDLVALTNKKIDFAPLTFEPSTRPQPMLQTVDLLQQPAAETPASVHLQQTFRVPQRLIYQNTVANHYALAGL